MEVGEVEGVQVQVDVGEVEGVQVEVEEGVEVEEYARFDVVRPSSGRRPSVPRSRAPFTLTLPVHRGRYRRAASPLIIK